MDFDSVNLPGLNAALNNPQTADNPWVTEARDALLGREMAHDLRSLPTAQDIAVDRQNVLQAARVIQDVLDSYGKQVRESLDRLVVRTPAEDPISSAATEAWNDLLVRDEDSFANRTREYLTALQNLVTNLTETARAYGYNDDEIRTVMDRMHPGGRPEQNPEN